MNTIIFKKFSIFSAFNLYFGTSLLTGGCQIADLGYLGDWERLNSRFGPVEKNCPSF